MTRFAVTGASGFIAIQLISDLLEAGHEVIGTLRNLSRQTELVEDLSRRGSPTEKLSFQKADLLSDDGWALAFEGCHGIFHVASPVPTINRRNDPQLLSVAVGGTLRVLEAALAAKVSRVVLTSSIAAIGNSSRKIFDETDWADISPSSKISAYARSKAEAERTAWNFVAANPSLELAVINPGVVFGPLPEADFGSSAQIIHRLLSGSIPALPPMGFEVVDVRDVAQLEMAAMARPEANGERYICTSELIKLNEIAKLLRAEFGSDAKRVARLQVPAWFARALALLKPEARGFAKDIGNLNRFSNAKAKAELGFAPRPAREATLAAARSILGLTHDSK